MNANKELNISIRPATEQDAIKVQELRNHAWQVRYINPDSGVTRDLLSSSLAPLPPKQESVNTYINMLRKPKNRELNLVATVDQEVAGTVFYDELEDGTGDIGVFVADNLADQGVGDTLLECLIQKTTNPLQVIIFAKNPSRNFYKKHGFVEIGLEDKHYFDKEVYLPTQILRLIR